MAANHPPPNHGIVFINGSAHRCRLVGERFANGDTVWQAEVEKDPVPFPMTLLGVHDLAAYVWNNRENGDTDE